MNGQFKRILDLVRRTGDRMIVTDADGESAYVVMGLDQYEDLITSGHGAPKEDEAVDWDPSMYGDLIPTEEHAAEPQHDDRPQDLRKAVEHDLAILEAWKNEQDAPKKSQDEPKVNPDEERFYLEPIE